MQLPLLRAPAIRTSGSSLRVVLVLAPDFLAPVPHQRHRFPPMGPAVVAAVLREDGVDVSLVDLAMRVSLEPLAAAFEPVLDRARLERYLLGGGDPGLEALEEELVGRVGDLQTDVFAFSVERHTQVNAALLLAMALKRRTGKPVVLGGGNFGGTWASQNLDALVGIDVVTVAASPDEIRGVFREVRELPQQRRAAPYDPFTELKPTPLDDWPLPDFSIFDLDLYRRDPFSADGDAYPSYDGSFGPRLFLPYAMSLDCQYACAFCQRGGSQSVRSMDKCVRDLATLAERYGTRDFLFFNSQLNLHAEAFSQAVIDAKLDIQWGDSFRIAPRRPRHVLETMAKAGCRQLTFGVESGSDRMLKKMVKGHTAQMATATVQDAHALGIYTRANLLPCFPGETPEDFALTEAWVRDNAFAIDDISPSAYYLTLASPVGENPARWGISIREVRDSVEGDHRFRKAHAPISYDEVDGLPWEEREATLRSSEHLLRAAWREGRSALGYGCTRPAQAFALSSRFATKAEAYAQVGAWVRKSGGQAPDVASVAALLARPGADADTAGPLEALRAKALAALRKALPPHLDVAPGRPEAGRVTLTVSGDGTSCRFVLERASPDRRAFRTQGPLAFWYATQGREPSWLGASLQPAAQALLSPQLVALATALDEAKAPVVAEGFPRWSVVDLVRQQLKPSATMLERDQADPFAGLDDLPAKELSRLYFARDASGALRAAPSGRRMVYVARQQAVVERLRDIEEAIYAQDRSRTLSEAQFIELQDEFGRLLGFPGCCTRAYAPWSLRSSPYADYYAALVRLEAHLRPIDWRANFLMASFYQFPFFIHVPCRLDCDSTWSMVEASVKAAYPGRAGQLVRAALSTSAVVFPDDCIVPFRAIGTPDGDELVVTEFNADPAPEALANPRDPRREMPTDSQPRFRDAEVEMLRVRDGGLEVFAKGCWHPFQPRASALGHPPIVMVATEA